MDNTIQRKNLNISSPREIWEQIKFSILNPQQRKGVTLFKHAVSRCMKILGEGNWRTPIGFNNHSAYGVEINQKKLNQITAWQKQKAEESAIAKDFFNNVRNEKIFNHQRENEINNLNEKAMTLAKQISRLTQASHSSEENAQVISEAVNELVKQLERLIRQGAEKAPIVNYLKQIGS